MIIRPKTATLLLRLVFLIIGLALVLFPFYITVVTAFKTPQESTQNFFALPSSFNLDNFRTVAQRSNYWRFVFNSTVISVVSVCFIAVLIPMASYAIARNFNRRYYKSLYYFIVMGIFIPFQVIMLPLSISMRRAGLNNIMGVILFYIGVSFMKGIFLFTNYIRTTVPIELEESVYMDGGSVTRAYFSIVYPLIMPMVATIVVLDFLWIWNDFMVPLILLNRNPSNWTLPLFQYNFKTQYTFEYNLAFASYIMSIFPVLLVYIFAQKYIVSGLTAGAVKS